MRAWPTDAETSSNAFARCRCVGNVGQNQIRDWLARRHLRVRRRATVDKGIKMKMKNERFDQLAYARRIRHAGRPIHIPEDDGTRGCIPSDELRVRQTGGVHESAAFDCGAGTGVSIYLIITSLKSKIAISSAELTLPWEQPFFHWLEDPIVIDGLSKGYRFPDPKTPEFARDEVLNHRLDLTLPISSGESLKGFLLGFGDPMPPEIRHGQPIPAFLILYDERGRVFRAPLELWADRSEKNHRPKRLPPKRKSIFDERDAPSQKRA